MDKMCFAERIRDIWADALRAPVDDDSDYFVLGGHSFQALQIIARIDDAFGTRLPLRIIFDSPRFGDFVDSVVAHGGLT